MKSNGDKGLEFNSLDLVELSQTINIIRKEVEKINKSYSTSHTYISLSDDLLTVKQVANYFGCSPQNIYNRIYRGHFKCTRLGGRVFIRKSELENL